MNKILIHTVRWLLLQLKPKNKAARKEIHWLREQLQWMLWDVNRIDRPRKEKP